MSGIRVNKTDLAHIFGVEPPVIDLWLRKGLPYLKKPMQKNDGHSNVREWLFNTADVIEWRVSTRRIDNEW